MNYILTPFRFLIVGTAFLFGALPANAVFNDTVTQYTLTQASWGAAFDGTDFWFGNETGNSITKITPNGVRTVYVGTNNRPTQVLFDGTNIWTANSGRNPTPTPYGISKYTPGGSFVNYPMTHMPVGIIFDSTNIWTANHPGNLSATPFTITKISPSGAMTNYSIRQGQPTAMTFDGSNIWVASAPFDAAGSRTISKISLSGSVLNSYSIPSAQPFAYTTITSIVFDGSDIWFSGVQGDLVKLSSSGVLTTYVTDNNATIFTTGKLAFDGVNLWMATDRSLLKIALDGGVIASYSLGTGASTGIAIGSAKTVWVSADNSKIFKVTEPPDLVIQGDIVPQQVSGGLKLSASVLNEGPGSRPQSFSSIFQFASNALGEIPQSPVSPTEGSPMLGLDIGESGEISYLITTPGVYYVRACVDNSTSWTDAVPESNEGNNCSAWQEINYSLPDLTASSVSPVFLGSVIAESPVTLISSIRNSGSVAVSSVVNTIFQFSSSLSGLNPQTPVLGSVLNSGVGANTTQSSVYEWTPELPGSYYVRACADNTTSWAGSIEESNESNNCGAWSEVLVGAPIEDNCHSCPTGQAYTVQNGCVPIKCPAGQKVFGAFCIPE